MQFALLPVLSFFEELYQQPIGQQRFNTYLAKLKGDRKDELKSAIMGYNPMAKDHALIKVQQLQQLEAEAIALESINAFNKEQQAKSTEPFKLVINLADDLHGAWSHRAATEFDSKFRFEGTFNHGFCTPYFWTSEELSTEIIQQRIKEYMHRTVFWQNNTGEKNLAYFVAQEHYVYSQFNEPESSVDDAEFSAIKDIYKEHLQTTNYSIIFNFFYGDVACLKLGYPTFGITDLTGFDFAKQLTN